MRPAPPAANARPKSSPNKRTIPRLNKTQTGRVEKSKVITIADLTEAVNLTKKISRGGQPGTSGSNLPAFPVVTKLLGLVNELKREGVLPTTSAPTTTKTEAAQPDQKLSRRQRKLQNKAKSAAEAAAYKAAHEEACGTAPKDEPAMVESEPIKLEPMDSKPLDEERVPNVELLDPSLENPPQDSASLNLSAEAMADLMEFNDLVIQPNPVGALSDTDQQVTLDKDSESQTAPDS
jgi:hypothetical protein